MSVSASPVVTEANIKITESIYGLFRELFVKGSLTIPANEQSLDVIEALTCKSVKGVDGIIRFTYKGIKEFISEHAARVIGGVEPEDSLKFFGCVLAERTADGFDGPAIFASSDRVKEYAKFLGAADHLSFSEKSCAVDYAVLDFIDADTGKSYDLYPGDTVVMLDDGYVVHQFSE